MCCSDGYANSSAEEIPLPDERKPVFTTALDTMKDCTKKLDTHVIHYRGDGQDDRLAETMLEVCKQDPGQVTVGDSVYTHEYVFSTKTFPPIMRVLGGLGLFLAVKNMKYGNSALEPKRIFSRASAEEQLLVRLDDKMSRLMERKETELAKNDVVDVIGYLVLYCVMKGWFSFRDLLD